MNKKQRTGLFSARILLILQPPLNAKTAADTIRRALSATARPFALRFALPHQLEGQLEDLPAEASLVYYDAFQGLSTAAALATDETHFLLLTGPHAFTPRWDNALCSLWRSTGRSSLLTGSITPAAAPDAAAENGDTLRIPASPTAGSRIAALRQALPALQHKRASASAEPKGILRHLPAHPAQAPRSTAAEAHLPALKEVQEDGSALLGRGLPLVCAAAPVRTLVADPCLLFGPISFLKQEGLATDTLSMYAYMAGYTVYALPEAIVWPLRMQPRQTLRLPSSETLPGTTLSRFEQLLGVRAQDRYCSPKTAMGLFGHEDVYSQRMPGKLVLSQKARSACMKLLEQPMPLMVTAFIDLPNPRVDPAFYLLRFGFLRRVESLPLLMYTGGSQERALRAAFPNTQSYPDNKLLPASLLQSGMKPAEYFARNKTLLMQRAAKRRVEFTHAAWLDMDILPHPICREAVPDFSPMMDDRIHIATVGGVPDPSFVVVPVERLEQLARLAQSITQLDAELKRGFGEPVLWERIFQKKPEWFAIHRMPRKRLLFLSAFDAQLLSRSVRPLLENLPTPHYATQADAAPRPKPEKENALNV